MATLSTMLRSMNNVSSQSNTFSSSLEAVNGQAATASTNIAALSTSMGNTEEASSSASKGLGKLISKIDLLKAAKNIMKWTDEFNNTSASLKLINDGLQTQEELQNKVFASAGRSRTSYTEMAAAVSIMNSQAGGSFKNNNEAIGFTELMKKSLVISGADEGAQESTISNVSTSMASGSLQGDNFDSVINNAPLAAQAIADYMGVPAMELKKLSEEGAITADVFKNAMFKASDDINNKFSSLPMTFLQVWTKIQTAGQQAFGNVFTKISEILNSSSVQSVISNFAGAIYFAGDIVKEFIDFVATNWPILEPLIQGAALMWILFSANAMTAWIATIKNVAAMALKAAADWIEYAAIIGLIFAQNGFNAALSACPITWIIGAIILLIVAFYAVIGAMNKSGETANSATGIIFGAFAAVFAVIWNIIVGLVEFILMCINGLVNAFVTFGNFFGNIFENPISSIIYLFQGLADIVLGIIEKIVSAIDFVFGTNLSDKVAGMREGLKGMADNAVAKYAPNEDYDKKIENVDISLDAIGVTGIKPEDAWDAGNELGDSVEDKFKDPFSGFDKLNQNDTKKNYSFGDNDNEAAISNNPPSFEGDQVGTNTNPAVMEGTGQNGSVEVNMADEDIQYLRDLSQRDYIAKVANNTLAPNVYVEFSGPITKEADMDVLITRVSDIMQDEISACPEGGTY